MQPRTIRFPTPLDDQLRKRHYETREPINTIVVRAVHMMLNGAGSNQEALAKWFERNPVPADPEEDSDGG